MELKDGTTWNKGEAGYFGMICHMQRMGDERLVGGENSSEVQENSSWGRLYVKRMDTFNECAGE